MLQKQAIPINFAKGLDTKTDPFQLDIGSFLVLKNSVFTAGKRLTKRNGFGALASLPYAASFATTFNGDLTAVGSNIEVYSGGNNSWAVKGSVDPVTLSTLPLVRNSFNQSQCDSVIASNGYVCTVYTENNGSTNAYKYVIADSVTGQNIIAPTTISGADATYGSPKVFYLDPYFIVAYASKNVSNYFISYIAISTTNPSSVTSQANISTTNYGPSSTTAFDGVVLNNNLYFAWNRASSTGIVMAYLTSTLGVSSTVTVESSLSASIVSVCGDPALGTIYVNYYNSGSSIASLLSVNSQLQVVISSISISSGKTLVNIASGASDSSLMILYEVLNTVSGVPANYIESVFYPLGGILQQPAVAIRSLGLASKCFFYNGSYYALCAYQSTYQPTYFLVNFSLSTAASPVVVARLAYENGGGYLLSGLPSALVINENSVSIAYLYKDLVQALSDANSAGTQTVGGIYSQTGINLATFEFGDQGLTTAEIGDNLNIAGCGYLLGYDGYQVTEQGFHLWPDPLQVSTNASAVTPTGTVTSGSNIITAVSSIAGVGLGASVTGTGIPANQVVTGFTSNTITFGPLTATGTHAAETITVTGNITASQYYYVGIYSWTDNQGNTFRSAASIPVEQTTTGTTSTNTIVFPTLRVTSKVATPVKLEIYRWSTNQPIYYEVTSVTAPTLNDTTIDSISIVDSLADLSIVGNAILYTTGGVLEDTGAPASSAMTLFDDRLWLVDAEDPNLLWFSKQVIEATPVEMSDLLTLYVAPTIGATGPTGPITALSAMDDKLIVLKKNAMYYINGTGPDNTGANNQYSPPTFITSMVGCTNQRSIVFQPQGLMFEFASEAGNQIWILKRDLSTEYIGAAVEGLMQGASVLSSIAVPGTNEVRFNLSTGITLMYDYFYGQWGIHTTNGLSSTLYQGLHTYIDSIGRVFQETPGQYLDGTNPVLLSFTTSWINVAGIRGYQRAFFFFLLGQYLTPFKLACSVAYDYESGPTSFATIAPTNFTPTYGGTQSNGQTTVYGADTPYGGSGNTLNWRVFLKKQRCSSFQITVQEIYDPSFGVPAGEGFTLSGLSLICALKSPFKTISSGHSVGAS